MSASGQEPGPPARRVTAANRKQSLIEGADGLGLEVVSWTPEDPAHPTPLLFVHGAFAAAWVWEPHFLPYFAVHGYDVHALSLRGHGGSDGGEGLLLARLKDYVADVAAVAARLPAPPVLIGHSMGGMVTQKYLHTHPTPAVVLLASPPPEGLLRCWLNMAVNHPRLLAQITLLQTFGPWAPMDPVLIRRSLFSEATPKEVLRRMMPRMGRESPFAILDLWGLDLPPSARALNLPVLVLGAGNDPFIPAGAVHATGRTYRAPAEVFPHMAHAMMLDHHWERVAGRILAWLQGTLPVPPAWRFEGGGQVKAA